MTVPASWVDELVPYNGPCGLCGDTAVGARHRVLDAVAERVRAGDSVEAVAEDYGYPVWFCQRLADEWDTAP